jgi:hypothetical protein
VWAALSGVVGSLFAERSTGRAGVGNASFSLKDLNQKKLQCRIRNPEPTFPTHDLRLRKKPKYVEPTR